VAAEAFRDLASLKVLCVPASSDAVNRAPWVEAGRVLVSNESTYLTVPELIRCRLLDFPGAIPWSSPSACQTASFGAA